MALGALAVVRAGVPETGLLFVAVIFPVACIRGFFTGVTSSISCFKTSSGIFASFLTTSVWDTSVVSGLEIDEDKETGSLVLFEILESGERG